MLQSLILAREEDIERSKIICKELEDHKITTENRNNLMVELDRLTGKVLRKINDEILQDLNNLGPLLRGNFIKKVNETYSAEIENKEKIERWGWVVEYVNGEKRMYDPTVDESERKFEKIPRVNVERSRVVYLCETNREQVFKIKEILMNFWAKVKGEFKNISIDKILEEKRSTEMEISKVDRSLMKRENLSEVDFLDADFIQKPLRGQVRPKDQDSELFYNFEQMQKQVQI